MVYIFKYSHKNIFAWNSLVPMFANVFNHQYQIVKILFSVSSLYYLIMYNINIVCHDYIKK